MKLKISAAFAAVACALTLVAGAARADTITFDVFAVFGGTFGSPCVGCALGGNIVIDTTLGTIVSADVTMTGQSVGPFTELVPVI